MTAPSYRFRFEIVDQETGEVVERDWVTLPDTDPVGFCTLSINTHVAQMLHNWRTFARAEYERENYQVPA
jgi:hypothetical protein